jgi:hypothetical protein
MIICNIFNKSNVINYKKFLDSRKIDLDIYYQPEFLELEASLINGEYEIFTLTNKLEDVFIYPYLKVSFEGEFSKYIDLVSPYGYAGPFCNNPSFFKFSEDEFIKYAKTQNVVSEFVRYHFLYNRELQFSRIIKNEANRTIVAYNLSKSWDDIWSNDVVMNNRNYVRKLEKEGYKFEISDSPKDLSEFIELYYQTMKHTNASDFFYFKEQYFNQLFKALRNKVMFSRIVKDGITYSATIMFVSGSIVQLFLNCRNLKFPKISATGPLYINTAKWAKEQGLKILNIGGGNTNLPDDDLFKFKKKLSKTYYTFYIGKRIINNEIYQLLIKKYIDENGYDNYRKVMHRLQFYRL